MGAHEVPLIKDSGGGLMGGSAHRMTEEGLQSEMTHPRSQRTFIIVSDQKSVVPIGNEISREAVRGGDDRDALCHRFYYDSPARLIQGMSHQDIGFEHHRRDPRWIQVTPPLHEPFRFVIG